MIYVNSKFLCQRMSGVQRYAVELSIRLKQHYGENITFISPHNIVLEEYADILQVLKIGSHTNYWWEQIDLPLFLKKKDKPLLINLCNMAPLFYNNSIYTLHDAAFKGYAQAYSRKYRIVYGFMVPILLKRCKHVITVSEFSKNEINRLYGTNKNKIDVINSAVSPLFLPSETHQRSIQNKITDPFLFTITSSGRNKNFLMTLKVFEEASKKVPNLKLYAAGKSLKDAKYTEYKEYADNKKIIFLGYVSDEEILFYYQNALAFIFPSIYEGFGLPPLEAQMCECPVIASSSGPLPEVLSDSALCASPFDKDALAKHVITLYEHPEIAKELKKKGLENVKKYSFEKSADKLIHLIERFNK